VEGDLGREEKVLKKAGDLAKQPSRLPHRKHARGGEIETQNM